MTDSGVRYVVIGGGIAGVTCVETLSQREDARITLLSASPLVKAVRKFVQVTRFGETFDVEEIPLEDVCERRCNVSVIQAAVTSLSVEDKALQTSDGKVIKYDKLCICTGGKPKIIAKDNPYVIGIRDTESVKDFQNKVKSARRIMIVGNGGIATELVYELEGCEVIWAIKDRCIAHTFVDAGAGEFFTEQLNKDKDKSEESPSKRLKYTIAESSAAKTGVMGSALGPDWTVDLDIRGAEQISHRVHVEKEVEVLRVLSQQEFRQLGVADTLMNEDEEVSEDWPVYVQLSNKKIYGCNLVVSATGVKPCTDLVLEGNEFELAMDGGLKVNSKMETSQPDVYAAGDVCTACWELSPHWQQMRLWSQARQMGHYAAKCMLAASAGEDIHMDFCFELFAHVTNFFNFKVILLGKFNAQGLGDDYEILLRMTKGEEYIKVILQDGMMVGAILIGDTDLEETFENLILNGMDLTPFKEHLLEPGIDIEDFFD